MPSSLSDLTAPERHQRLTIAEIHRLWNDELHEKAGREQCKWEEEPSSSQNSTPSAELSSSPNLTHLLGFANTLLRTQKIGRWQDPSGQIACDEPIQEILIRLVKKGDLRAYASMDPEDKPAPIKKLPQVNLKANAHRCLIDRDELGRLLVQEGETLPAFWYSPADQNRYQTEWTQEREEKRALREQRDALRAENEELKRQLDEARAFMNPQHPFFAPELEACVAAWEACYNDKALSSKTVAKKDTHGEWLIKHRSPVVFNEEGALSERALQRMSMVVNPNKKSGRPKG